jgi:hypothetical protein
METQELKGADVTQEVIARWIEKYGKGRVKQIDLPLDDLSDQVLPVYARVPDRRILGEWEKWSDKNPDKAKEILVKNCLLTDVARVCADQDLFFCALQAITELIPIRKAIIKNL